MRRLKRWGLAALLVLLGMEILTVAPKKVGSPKDAQEKPKDPDKITHSAIATVSQTMHGVHLVETGSGRKEWELDSQSAQGTKDKGGTWKLQGVQVKFFGTAGLVYTVTGKSGTIQTETKDMNIEGNVVGTTSEGYVFKTKSLKYGAKERLLTTNDDVTMTGPKKDGPFELSGKGFSATLSDSTMLLKENVKAVKGLSGDRTMNIKSVWARISGKNNEAHFENNVQVDMDTVRMTGNQADFMYDKSTHLLNSLLLQGNVKVTDQTHWASSQYAQVLFKENEFVLYGGSPRVIQDDNELRGDEIRFLQGGKEVRVVKAKARMENKASLTELRKGG